MKLIDTVKPKQKAILLKTNCNCGYCGIELTVRNFTVDHISPRGGKDEHAAENLIAACRSCNSKKNRKSLEQFRTWVSYEYIARELYFSGAQIEWLIENLDLREKYPRDAHVFYFEALLMQREK